MTRQQQRKREWRSKLSPHSRLFIFIFNFFLSDQAKKIYHTFFNFRELSTKPDVYERLARAIAPSIYENEDIKKGILLQLFGGSKKDLTATGRGRFRTEINILLCGDPGTSKSQLLQYVYNLVPRSQVRRSNKSPKSTEISKLHFLLLFALLVVNINVKAQSNASCELFELDTDLFYITKI